MAVHCSRDPQYGLSSVEGSARSLDDPYLISHSVSHRGRRLFAVWCEMGPVAGARLGCVSRRGERIKLTIGCFAPRSSSFGCRSCPARAADVPIFSASAAQVIGSFQVKGRNRSRNSASGSVLFCFYRIHFPNRRGAEAETVAKTPLSGENFAILRHVFS